MSIRFFLYGLLADPDIFAVVIGRPAPAEAFPGAVLAHYRLARLDGESYPVLAPAPGVRVWGAVVEGLSPREIERLRFYESVEYEAAPATVTLLAGGNLEVQVFSAAQPGKVGDEEWRIEDWRATRKVHDLREARLWMALCGHLDVAEADRRWDQAVARGRALEDFVKEVVEGRART